MTGITVFYNLTVLHGITVLYNDIAKHQSELWYKRQKKKKKT